MKGLHLLISGISLTFGFSIPAAAQAQRVYSLPAASVNLVACVQRGGANREVYRLQYSIDGDQYSLPGLMSKEDCESLARRWDESRNTDSVINFTDGHFASISSASPSQIPGVQFENCTELSTQSKPVPVCGPRVRTLKLECRSSIGTINITVPCEDETGTCIRRFLGDNASPARQEGAAR